MWVDMAYVVSLARALTDARDVLYPYECYADNVVNYVRICTM